ncbi:MAG: hypothetical protein J5522_07910 [Lachnospiraceae bacterium]|nr:hypothetical protein [Lachnospiraceae bacterium]MBR4815989.1 hypothetical protein [Lachnospiraceae bacterium]
MQVMLNEEEQKRQEEIEAYEQEKEAEMAQKAINDKAKRKKADKYFRLIVFGLIFLTLAAVAINWLVNSNGLAY